MLKVAIVGCGKIADSHLGQIQRIPGCKVLGACDREPLMAQQLCQRFNIQDPFSDVAQMLARCKPDVVHITTPPQSHFLLAQQCLEQGCHVYLEKPFTLNTAEARNLFSLAGSKKLHIIAGHDDQFSHVARRMRRLVQSGYLGGPPVHMESLYCYDLGGSGYANALLNDKRHWVRKLPGGLFQNVISHGIARIAEFLSGEIAQVMTMGFVSPFLRRLGETEILDEIRVIIADEKGTTAYLTFSSQIRPSLHQFRIYGPKNALILDEDQQALVKARGKRLKSYAEKFIPPILMASDYLGNCLINLRLFAANDFQMKSGMKFLIESFYDCITKGTPLPVTPREIVLNSEIMDAVINQMRSTKFNQMAEGGPTLAVSDSCKTNQVSALLPGE